MAQTLTESQTTGDPNPATGHPTIVVIDFGSQFSMLIARRVRELNTYCEMVPPETTREALAHHDIRGVILSGGPNSVYDAGAPQAPAWVFESGVPVLGICYGMQLLAHQLGGKVEPSGEREYGPASINHIANDKLLGGLPASLDVWMSHGDRITVAPPGFQSIATSANSPTAVMADLDRHYYGLQFHPEVVHTPRGKDIIGNFVHAILRRPRRLDGR